MGPSEWTDLDALDAIGQVVVPIKDLKSQEETNWYEVQKCGTVVTGHVLLQITRHEEKVVVVLCEGRNLASADPNGKSDPYVRLQLGAEKKKSGTVKETLNPVFHETFEFKTSSKSECQVLDVKVFDWDRVGSDDFL